MHVIVVLLLLILTPAFAGATAVHYTITYTVDALFGPQVEAFPGAFGHFDQLPQVGDVYYGSFDVDSSELLPGTGVTDLHIQNFYTKAESLEWDENRLDGFTPSPATPSVMRGFRSPGVGFSSSIQEARFIDGTLVGLSSGVFGAADYPFIDLFDGVGGLGTLGRFNVADLETNGAMGTYSIAVAAVPWPGGLELLALGSILVAACRGRTGDQFGPVAPRAGR